MTGHPDGDIWRHAQQEGRFLITQDLDFSDINLFSPGTHHGILQKFETAESKPVTHLIVLPN